MRRLLLLEGGGMRGGFVAGAVMALMERGFTFDAGVAVSASVPTLAYFVSGQREEMETVWRHELNTPRLVRYENIPYPALTGESRKPVLDIDYLVDKVFKEKYPIRDQALVRSKTRCHFAATKFPEGSLALFSPGQADIYDIFKACLAVPICFPGTVHLNGHEYIDGGVANPLPAKPFFNDENDRIVAVLSKPPAAADFNPGIFEKILLWRYFQKNGWLLNKLNEITNIYIDEFSFLDRLRRQSPPKAVAIYPEKMPPVNFISRNGTKINRTIDLGFKRVAECEEQIREVYGG